MDQEQPQTSENSPQKSMQPKDGEKKDLNQTNETAVRAVSANSEAERALAYDEDQVPPNVDLAEIHGEATKVYAAIPESEKNVKRKVCTCCGNAYDLQRLGTCCAKSDLYHLGVGFPMYFEFVMFCGILITIMLVVSGVYNLITNSREHDCVINFGMDSQSRAYCFFNKVHLISLVNKRFSDYQLIVNDWLNFAAVLIMVVSFQFYRRQSKLTIEEVDNSMQTPADFTIEISNIPVDANTDEIKDFFEKKVFTLNEAKVVKIVRGYNIGKYVTLQRKKALLQAQLADKEVKNREKLEKEYESVKNEVDEIEKDSGKTLELSRYAYVIFEREDITREALKRLDYKSITDRIFSFLGCSNCFETIRFRDSIRLKAERAPEPSDIIWENLGTSRTEKRKRRFISLIVSILVIVICGAILIGINVGKNKLNGLKDKHPQKKHDSKSVGIQILSILIAFSISFLNSSLAISTRKFASYESHSTYTQYFVSVAQRLSLSTFINTAITILVTDYILEILWNEGGLLSNIFIVFLIAVVLGPIYNLLNPFYFLKLYQRWKVRNQGKSCTLTQKQANLLFEGPPIDMAQCYAVVLKSLWLTAFYAPVLPIGLPISLVGLFLTYWTNKYLLLNRYSKPLELGKTLSQSMAEFLELTPFFFALGHIVFRYLIIQDIPEVSDDAKKFYLPSILGLGISFLNFVLPAGFFNCCSSDKDNVDYNYKKTYSEMRVFFNNDYAISNPIYHNEALEEWLEILEKGDKEKFKAIHQLVKAEIKQDDGMRTSNRNNTGGFALQNLQNYAQRTQGLAQFHHSRPQYMAPPPQSPVFFNVSQNFVRQGPTGNTYIQDGRLVQNGPIQYYNTQFSQPTNRPLIQGPFPQNNSIVVNPNVSVSLSYGQPMPQPVQQSFPQPINPPFQQPLPQPVQQSFPQPINPPFQQPIIQPIIHPVQQPTPQPNIYSNINQNSYPQPPQISYNQFGPNPNQFPSNPINIPQRPISQNGPQFNGYQPNMPYNQPMNYPPQNQGMMPSISLNPNPVQVNPQGQTSFNYTVNFNAVQGNPY